MGQRFWLVPFLALVACAGCTHLVWEPEEIPPQHYQKPLHVPDIPLPRDFDYVTSGVFLSGPFRVAELQYKGDASVEDATNFFQQYMPQHGWKSEEALHSEAEQRSLVRFTKDLEKCLVTVERKSQKTSLTINVSYR